MMCTHLHAEVVSDKINSKSVFLFLLQQATTQNKLKIERLIKEIEYFKEEPNEIIE